MDRSDFRLRALLLDIDQSLSNDDRKMLCFLIGSEDVPRRLLDVIAKDNTASMHDIWETLFDRRKITVGNVSYLVTRLEKIQRMDLAQRLREYCPLPFSLSTAPTTASANRVEQRSTPSDLFHRTDPQNH